MKRLVKSIVSILLLLAGLATVWGQSVTELRWIPTAELDSEPDLGVNLKMSMQLSLEAAFNKLGSDYQLNHNGKMALTPGEKSYYFAESNLFSGATDPDFLTYNMINHMECLEIWMRMAWGNEANYGKAYFDWSFTISEELWNYRVYKSGRPTVATRINAINPRYSTNHGYFYIGETLNGTALNKMHILRKPFLTPPDNLYEYSKTGVRYEQSSSQGCDHGQRIIRSDSTLKYYKALSPQVSLIDFFTGRVGRTRFKASEIKKVDIRTGHRVKLFVVNLYKDGSALPYRSYERYADSSGLTPEDGGIDSFLFELQANEPLEEGYYKLVIGTIDKFNKIYIFEPKKFIIDNSPLLNSKDSGVNNAKIERSHLRWLRSKELLPANINEQYKNDLISELTTTFNSLGEYKTKPLLDIKDELYYFNDKQKESFIQGEDYSTVAAVSAIGKNWVSLDYLNKHTFVSRGGDFSNYSWLTLTINGGHKSYSMDTKKGRVDFKLVWFGLRNAEKPCPIDEKLQVKKLLPGNIFLTEPPLTYSLAGKDNWNRAPAWSENKWHGVKVVSKEMYRARDPYVEMVYRPFTGSFKTISLNTDRKVKAINVRLYDEAGSLLFSKVEKTLTADCIDRISLIPENILADKVNTLKDLGTGRYTLVVGLIDKFNKIYIYKPEELVIDRTPPVVNLKAGIPLLNEGKLFNGVRYIDGSRADKLLEWQSIDDDVSAYDNPADYLFIKLEGEGKFYQATSSEFVNRGLFFSLNDGLILSKKGEPVVIEALYIADRAGNRFEVPRVNSTLMEDFIIGGTKGSYTYFNDIGPPVLFDDSAANGALNYYQESAGWIGLKDKVKEQKRAHYIDTNRDGFVDLVYSNESGGLTVYLNNKQGGFNEIADWSGLLSLGDIVEPGFIFIDMDNDKNEDLVRLDTKAQRAFIYLNTGLTGFSLTPDWDLFIGEDSYKGVIHYPEMRDIDNDGVPDFVSFSCNKTVMNPGFNEIYKNEITINISYGARKYDKSSGFSESYIIGAPQASTAMAAGRFDKVKFEADKFYLIAPPIFIDYNNDNVEDIVILNHFSNWAAVLLNIGKKFQYSESYSLSSITNYEVIDFKSADIDNNSFKDLIFAIKERDYSQPNSYNFRFDLFLDNRNRDSKNMFESVHWRQPVQLGEKLENDRFIDVNGDGFLDWIRLDDHTNLTEVHLNTKKSGFSDNTLWSSQNISGSSPAEFNFIDLDRDGFCEVLRVSSTGGLEIYKNVARSFTTTDTLKFNIQEDSKLFKINRLSLTGLDKTGKSNSYSNVVALDIPLEMPEGIFDELLSAMTVADRDFMKTIAFRYNSHSRSYIFNRKLGNDDEIRLRTLLFESGYNNYRGGDSIVVPLEILRGESDGEYRLYCELEDVVGGLNRAGEYYFKVVNNQPANQINIDVKGRAPLSPGTVAEYNGECLVEIKVVDPLFKSFDLEIRSDNPNSSNMRLQNGVKVRESGFTLLKDSASPYESLTLEVTAYDKYDNRFVTSKEIRLFNDNSAPAVSYVTDSINPEKHTVTLTDESTGSLSAYKVVELDEANSIPGDSFTTVPSYRGGLWQGAAGWTTSSAGSYELLLSAGKGLLIYSCDRWGNDNSASLSTFKVERPINYDITIASEAEWNSYKNQILKGKIYISYNIDLTITDHLQIAGDTVKPTIVYINSSTGIANTRGGKITLDSSAGAITFIGSGGGESPYKWDGIKVGASSKLHFAGANPITFKNAGAALIFESPELPSTLSNLVFNNCLIGIHWLDEGTAYDKLNVAKSSFIDCVYGVKLDLLSGSYLVNDPANYLNIDSASSTFTRMSRAKYYWNGIDY